MSYYFVRFSPYLCKIVQIMHSSFLIMVRYRVELVDRISTDGEDHICDNCTNDNCTNPIGNVEVAVGGLHTERLWLKYDKKEIPKLDGVISNESPYYSVLSCDGYKPKTEDKKGK
jgi:hypothetical protein